MTSGAPRRHPHASAPPKYTAQTSVQLTPARAEQVKDLADEFQVSASEILRRAIDQGIDRVAATFHPTQVGAA